MSKGRKGIILVGAAVAAISLAWTVPPVSSQAAGGGETPIVIGNVTHITGASASSFTGYIHGLRAWVKDINERGGIRNHRVELVVEDAKSDLTAEAAAIQNIIAADDPVAFLSYGARNAPTAAPFVEEAGIPIIGGNTAGSTIWEHSPLLYSPGPSYSTAVFAFAASAPENSRYGITYCTESPGCSAFYTALFEQGLAEAAGVDPVYSARVSQSSPDFTAQCLAARDEEITHMLVTFPPVQSLKYATDCAAQGYTPTYIWYANAAPLESTGDLSGLEGLAIDSALPWTVKGGPAKEFRKAMKKYQPGKPISNAAISSWVAAKTFEKAAKQALADNGNTALTSEQLIAALGTMKDETLGGLAAPFTFTSGQSEQPLSRCWFVSKLEDGQWTAGARRKHLCAEGDSVVALEELRESAGR